MLPSTFQNEVLQQSQMYEANEAWAQKLSGEGYTVVDIGNSANAGASVFHTIEEQVIIGDK